MRVHGILLTGGASSRMGSDKALLEVGGRRLVDIAAALLGAVSTSAIEVGPGLSELPAIVEEPRGRGPLAALVAGADALAARGRQRPILLLAVDMPFLSLELLRLLASLAGGEAAVVPVAEARMQPLCAVYPPLAVTVGRRLLEEGKRSMAALLEAIPLVTVPPEDWAGSAPPDAFVDLDTRAAFDAVTLEERVASP